MAIHAISDFLMTFLGAYAPPVRFEDRFSDSLASHGRKKAKKTRDAAQLFERSWS